MSLCLRKYMTLSCGTDRGTGFFEDPPKGKKKDNFHAGYLFFIDIERNARVSSPKETFQLPAENFLPLTINDTCLLGLSRNRHFFLTVLSFSSPTARPVHLPIKDRALSPSTVPFLTSQSVEHVLGVDSP